MTGSDKKYKIYGMMFFLIKVILLGIMLFFAISFISFAFETLSITSSLRENDEILQVGFPFIMYEQFWVGDCDYLIKGWHPKNTIINYILSNLLSFIYFSIKYRIFKKPYP